MLVPSVIRMKPAAMKKLRAKAYPKALGAWLEQMVKPERNMTITETIARKVLATVDAGIMAGIGQPVPGKMCVEAATCFALDQPHGDEPDCVGRAVRGFVTALNDARWSSNESRTVGLRKIAVAQLGSENINQERFKVLLTLRTIQKLCPKLFRGLARASQNPADKSAMETAAVQCEEATELKIATETLTLTRALALDLALDLALTRDLDLTRDLALDLDLTLTLTRASDESLTLLADICLEVLVELTSPGCQWLFLCER